MKYVINAFTLYAIKPKVLHREVVSRPFLPSTHKTRKGRGYPYKIAS